jgi:hypothetical protein
MYATASIPLTAFPDSESARIGGFLAWQRFWRAWYAYYSDTATSTQKDAAEAQMAAARGELGVSSVSSEWTGEFNVWAWVAAMPGLAGIQAALDAPSMRAPVDLLVRAYHPCWVAVGLRLLHYGNADAIDVAAVARAVVAAVSGSGGNASSGVRASSIAAAVVDVVGDTAVLDMPISLRGRLRLPTDDVVMLSSETELRIPETYAALGVSPRTAAFFIDESGVEIELEAAT